MVEVAVIGAGAAGLVATHHLLRSGLRACLFESRLFTGGAWGAATKAATASNSASNSPGPNSGVPPQMWDNLTPNLSKYTCCFSDFPWPEGTPTFPTLANMNQYLDDYASKYVVNDEGCTLKFGCTVKRVSCSGSSDQSRYHVEWADEKGASRSQQFDGVVVATGFFSVPVWPEGLLHLVDEESNDSSCRVLHSSQYRSPIEFTNQTVAVIGGSFSAHEIAADVRRHAKRVVNVLGSHVPYVLPRYVPSLGDGILPIDCVLYQRRDDEVAPKIPETVTMDEGACQRRHGYLQSLIGSRKQAQAAAKGFPLLDRSSMKLPPVVSISDDYLNLVIDGKIEVVKGRLKGASMASLSPDTSSRCLDLELDDGRIVTGVNRIIACTGYRSRLDFLAPEILETLQYDESDPFAPFVLCYDAVHHAVPGMGFVGMYRGPYFGVMELQARLVAGLMCGRVGPLSNETIGKALAASQSIRKQQPRAQFPHFDYTGLMDSLAELLPVELVPKLGEFGAKGMMVSPAFYQPDENIARHCKNELDEEVRRQSDNIPLAALSALVGKWTFDRTITDSLTSATQKVHGEVRYSLQEPHFDCLRYREDGFLDLPNGNRLEVFREYEYLSKDGMLEIYFVENGARSYLFLSLKFEKQDNVYWLATSDHLCIKDLYTGTFKIAFDGLGASEVSMTYRVKGPNKDYESVTNLRPIL